MCACDVCACDTYVHVACVHVTCLCACNEHVVCVYVMCVCMWREVCVHVTCGVCCDPCVRVWGKANISWNLDLHIAHKSTPSLCLQLPLNFDCTY